MRRECNTVLGIILFLVTIGIMAVYSANAAYPMLQARVLRHLFYVAVGLVVLAALVRLDYHRLGSEFLVRFLTLLALVLLVAVLIPGVGVVRSGAQRWIEIGPVSFQPSEFAKFALLIFLAARLSVKQDEVTDFRRVFLPLAGVIFLFAGLIVLERDLGTPVVLAMAAFAVLVMGGVPWRYLGVAALPAVASVALLAITSEYRLKRLMAFLDPWSHRNEEGYQLIQSMTAFVGGGVWGHGPGGGEQKLYYLPEAHTDFIFAVWSEETGLAGSIVLALLFLGLLALALRIATHARDLFGSLLAGGAVTLIVMQAVFNMMVAIGLLPTKGLPLPFVSMGGTSLIVFLGLMGVVINVGLQAEPARRRAFAARNA
jgi:cell division protein FtsW